MVASPSPAARRLWLALPFLALVIILSVPAARAARQGPDEAEAANKVFMPLVRVPPPPPEFQFQPLVDLGNLTITDIASTGNAGDQRLFAATRDGQVYIVYPDGTVAPELFMDATKLVQLGADGSQNDFEQGFLGMAFHPNYPAVPYIFFAHTTPRTVTVTRVTLSATNPNKVDPQTFVPLIWKTKPPKDSAGNLSAVHNAGDLAFGPDGYLYIPIGDGGPDPYDPWGVPGDPNNHAQRLDVIFGKILRIDVDPSRGAPADCGVKGRYSVPRDNPFVGGAGCDEIWAVGLRNPWRMSIDPQTGDLYMGDVGEWKREEVNYLPRSAGGGANFGWHCWEGTFDYAAYHLTTYPQVQASCNAPRTYVKPVFEYDHSAGACSIIGGVFYRGAKYLTLQGRYFFADWCNGNLWTMVRENGQWKVDPAGDTMLPISTFGQGNDGSLYAGVYMDGTIYKVIVR